MNKFLKLISPISKKITKRKFLATAGVSAAAVSLGACAENKTSKNKWDLIVVGGGNAGLPTAIFAAERIGQSEFS